ncbi:MAG: FeoB-associated Cys-rich membrane protein [Rikenellaceae bacterium]|nr:FeoB-associated Cys-rich membrane protein [Rikenellaceae bacterium]
MSDAIAIAIVTVVVGVALWRLIRSFKNNDDKNDGCCGSCHCR